VFSIQAGAQAVASEFIMEFLVECEKLDHLDGPSHKALSIFNHVVAGEVLPKHLPERT
jgi:hypothetical protein